MDQNALATLLNTLSPQALGALVQQALLNSSSLAPQASQASSSHIAPPLSQQSHPPTNTQSQPITNSERYQPLFPAGSASTPGSTQNSTSGFQPFIGASAITPVQSTSHANRVRLQRAAETIPRSPRSPRRRGKAKHPPSMAKPKGVRACYREEDELLDVLVKVLPTAPRVSQPSTDLLHGFRRLTSISGAVLCFSSSTRLLQPLP